MPQSSDRTEDTSSTVGTGPLVINNAPPTGTQSLLTAYGSGITTSISYCITDSPAGVNWEVGRGTFYGSSRVFTRDAVSSSSNSGKLVSFTSGSLLIFVTIPANVIKKSNLGSQSALARGWALP